jgi:hypothetical protein
LYALILVRLLSSACTFTDYMRPTQPRVTPTSRLIPGFLCIVIDALFFEVAGLAPEDDDSFFHPNRFPAAHTTVHLIAPQLAVNQADGRSITRTPQSKLKSFFNDSINPTPLDTGASTHSSADSSTSPKTPRVEYVRDSNTPFAFAEDWYPAPLRSVRHPPFSTQSLVTPPAVPKSGGSPGTDGPRTAIDALMLLL